MAAGGAEARDGVAGVISLARTQQGPEAVVGRSSLGRFTLQLLLPIVAIVGAFVLVAAFYWSRAFEQLYVEALTQRLDREVWLVAGALPWDTSGESLDAACRLRAKDIGGRVTVIADDGRVVGESERPSASLENHGRREEVVEARANGIGRSVRFSHTVGEMVLNVAGLDVRSDGERRFVRIALPLRSLVRKERFIRGVLAYGFGGALLLGGAVAWWISRRVVERVRRVEEYARRIAAGEAPGRISGPPKARDELEVLEHRLGDIAASLHEQLTATEGERAKLEVVLRSMGDGVVVLDADGRIRLCNQSARDILEIGSLPEQLGTRLTFLCRQPDLTEAVDVVLRGESPSVQREIVLTGQDAPRSVLISVAGFHEKEEAHGAILVLHEVTRVRQLETMRADFVANVSHELRTPLTAIRGYAETLLNGALDDREKAVQFLQVIDRHSLRLARLIDDLLSISNLELGRAELHRRAISIGSLIEGVFEMLGQQAVARRITLAAEVAEDLPRVWADRDRIEEVLINLVDNAIKYSGPETTVTVQALSFAPEGRASVEISVIDQGIGIPEKDIPRLTERFYRVDKARSRELGGTGLGLAIVKHIVNAHEGKLRVESQVNVGTVVTVTLPAADDGDG